MHKSNFKNYMFQLFDHIQILVVNSNEKNEFFHLVGVPSLGSSLSIMDNSVESNQKEILNY